MGLLRHPMFIVVLFVLVILLFGSSKLPDLARSVGQSMKILKKDVKDMRGDTTPSAPPTATAPVVPGATAEPVAPVPPTLPATPSTPIVPAVHTAPVTPVTPAATTPEAAAPAAVEGDHTPSD